jgi:O-antigen/teichoic acid export membrane protein
MAHDTRSSLTRGGLLARNVAWNLAGQLMPMFVGLAVVPPLVRGLGVERFGVLSLAWMVVGYFSLFDLGLGRALTKLVADRLTDGDHRAIASLAWTSTVLMVVLGAIGTLVVWGLTPWLVQDALKVSPSLVPETLLGFYWLGTAIPLITATSGLRGLLEAHQEFAVINLIRVPISMLSFLGPLAVLPFSHSLVPVMVSLVAVRVVGTLAHLAACFRAFPALAGHRGFDGTLVGGVLRLGGWMTVTNIVGPVMTYLDRFLVGMILSVTAVAYYTAPFDVVTRLLFIPIGVVGVLFPAFAVTHDRDPDHAALLLSRGTKYVSLGLLPLLFVLAGFAPEGLRLWLGTTFAAASTAPLRWIAAGVFANALAQVPFAFLQAAGRPDATAKLHLAELPFYLLAVWFLTARMGITGTAIAWTVRAAVDAVLMFAVVAHVLPASRRFLSRLTLAAAGAAAAFAACSLPPSTLARGCTTAGVLVALAALGWTAALSPDERAYVKAIVAGPR